MQYRVMPKSGDKLSALGFGMMRLPTKVGGVASNMIDRERAQKQIWGAIDKGVNYLDTAFPYHLGASESFLGEYILKNGYREKVNIATKLPCMFINRKEQIDSFFKRQFEKIQVEQFDYYLLHSMSGDAWDKLLGFGILDFMDQIKKDGLVRNMGFSFHGKKEDFKRMIDGYDWDFAQVQFNILDENFQAGIEGINYAAEREIGIIVMEPLRGGSLVGKIPAEVQTLYDSAPIKRSAADWALRWVWDHPAVKVVLSGMNEEAHIEENIRVASEALPNGLSDVERAIVEEVRDTYLRIMQVGCTGCAYCMPCPAGIDIPSAFKNLNNYHMFGKALAQISHLNHAGINTDDGKAHWTSVCIDCGQCERACPQSIEVRKEFKKVQRDLEGWGVRAVASVARPIMNRKSTSEN